MRRSGWLLGYFLLLCGHALSQSSGEIEIPSRSPTSDQTGVDWRGVFLQSFEFLGLEHGFRYAAQEGTRHPHKSFFGGYVQSLDNLHGWADGDVFYVNYVGHSMQGATSGFIFVQNDRAYRTVEFGKNRAYWKSRLRATAFAWAYSAQFEVGPLSEASIGNTQASFPQQGFVDQVATPAIGLGWMIAEDSIDKYFIKRIEGKTRNKYVWAALRGGLNPTRSLANIMANRTPWHRDSRLDPGESYRDSLASVTTSVETREYPLAAPFEFFATTRIATAFGEGARGACIGGGGSAAFRVAEYWEVVGDVGGCKLTNFGKNMSGDSLTYQIGPRWTPRPADRWQPFAQVLIGGRKITHERLYPTEKAQLEAIATKDGVPLSYPDHASYTQDTADSGLALSAGIGLDLKMTSAIGLRVAQLDYLHSWNSRVTGIDYSNTLQFTFGLVLRFGTW